MFTVGYPNPTLQGINPKLSKGEISGLTGLQDDIRTFQISIPVQPGNSGGVLSDEECNAIGVITHKLDTLAVALVTGDVAQNVNYALKISYVLPLIDSIPGLAELIPAPMGSPMTFDQAAKKVNAASALVLSFGQPTDKTE